MAITQISPMSILATVSEVNPKQKAEQQTVPPQTTADASQAVQSKRTDTVTFSKEALLKLSDESSADTLKEQKKEKRTERHSAATHRRIDVRA